jgi:hypothetical protein
VLSAVLQFLLFHPLVAWAERMNSGAMALDGRYVRFGFVGCPDVLGQLKDGRFLAVECKAEGGSLTKAQSTFLARVERFGGVSGVARSVDDAAAILERAKLPRV